MSIDTILSDDNRYFNQRREDGEIKAQEFQSLNNIPDHFLDDIIIATFSHKMTAKEADKDSSNPSSASNETSSSGSSTKLGSPDTAVITNLAKEYHGFKKVEFGAEEPRGMVPSISDGNLPKPSIQNTFRSGNLYRETNPSTHQHALRGKAKLIATYYNLMGVGQCRVPRGFS